MKEDYVSYEQAVKLKELGFDWECDYCYLVENGNPSFEELDTYCFEMAAYKDCGIFFAPTLSLAQKWLREVKGWDVYVVPAVETFLGTKAYIWIVASHEEEYRYENEQHYSYYETALSDAIDHALKILEEKE